MTPFAALILNWYAQHARSLPWRGHPDPYAVWVSEIMLQQTRVETVIPYFTRWLERFPTLRALAEAAEKDVLSAWEGLGYYSRARNLHKAAQTMLARHNGQVPHSLAELRALPGIGRYTAGAITSIAFGQNEPTLDGNLRRVFARVFNVEIPADSTEGETHLWKLAAEHLPPGQAGDYNQALMDLGASICLPKKPTCPACPVSHLCQACALGLQEQRPVLKPKAAIPHKRKNAAIVVQDGNTLLARRPAQGLLGGLWEFPASEVDASRPLAWLQAIETEYGLSVTPGAPLAEMRHTYSHFRLSQTALHCELLALQPGSRLEWAALSGLATYPMGKVDRAIARKLATFIK